VDALSSAFSRVGGVHAMSSTPAARPVLLPAVGWQRCGDLTDESAQRPALPSHLQGPQPHRPGWFTPGGACRNGPSDEWRRAAA
jgi:hypothetical protein